MDRAWKHGIVIAAGLFVAVRYVLPGVLEDMSGPAQAEPQYAAPAEAVAEAPVRKWASAPRQPEDTPPEDATATAGNAVPLYAAPRRTAPDAWYPNCDAARAAGAAPIYSGEPGYRANLDGDGDGVACEPYHRR